MLIIFIYIMDYNQAFQVVDFSQNSQKHIQNEFDVNQDEQHKQYEIYQNSKEYKDKLAEHIANIKKNQQKTNTSDRQEAIKKQKEQEEEERKQKHEKDIDNYVAKYGEYWEYEEAQCFVPIRQFRSVNSMDKCNTTILRLYNNKPEITHTEMYMDVDPYTVDEYHNIFCKEEGDKWIYIGRNN